MPLSPEQTHELFDALDLSGEALKPAGDAWAKNDDAGAKHALATYFRQRTSVMWKFDPHNPDKTIPFDKQVANDAVKGVIKVGGLPIYNFANGQIDWLYNPSEAAGQVLNMEWQWNLCRMLFWEDMGKAYRATGDETYAKAWVQQMRSFVAQCPPPAELQNNGIKTAWRTIDTGVRLSGSWPDAFFSFLLSPSVSDDDLLLYLYSYLQNARFLATHHGQGNALTIEMNGLYTAGAILPEFKDAAAWRVYAVKTQMAQESEQFLPDGVERELTTGYHNTEVDSITGLMDVAKLTGRMNELPAGYIAPMEKAYDFDMYMTTPDGQIPEFNDSWRAHVAGYLKRALQYFPDRKDYLWFATGGKEGQPPADTSHTFDWAGYYAMRSSWAPDANYLVFRDGPLGVSHAHQDKLNVIMWPYGREVLFNGGGGTYDRSKWRGYSVETFSKNTVLVDGLPQHRDEKNFEANYSHAPIDARWESTADHDFAAGMYNDAYGEKGAHPATHSRRVLFLKPDLAIISDTLTPTDAQSHTYQARWNLRTINSKKVDGTNEVMTTDDGKPNLDIVPLNPDGLEVRSASGQSEPELLGWEVLHTGGEPFRATTVLHTRQGTGVQTFLTLLVPMQAGTVDPVKSVSATRPGTAEVVFSDGRKLAVTASADPTGGIEATETLADGSAGRHVKAGEPPP